MKRRIWTLVLVALTIVLGNIDAQTKKKSVAQLSKQYVKYAKDKAKGKAKKAEKKANDPATVTREKNDSTQEKRQKTFQEEFLAFKRQANTTYENFRDEANSKYADFLKQAWEQYQVHPAIPKPKEEKTPPVVMPEEARQKPLKDTPIPIEEEVVPPPAPEPQPVPVAPIKEAPKPQEQYVSFTLYGTAVKIRFNDDQRFTLNDCSESAVSSAWQRLSGTTFNNTIRDCLEKRVSLQLSDWAYLALIEKMAQTCLGHTNAATLLMAFVYCQSGYQMRLGMAGGRLMMLYASRHTIYNQSYFNIDGEKFYVYHNDARTMHIASVAFPQEKPMSLLVTQAQRFDYAGSVQRKLSSRDYKEMAVSVSTNKNLIDFYSGYPTSMTDNNFMTRWAMYANTPIDKTLKESFYPVLQKKLGSYGQKEKMERLLNFVQTAFEYEYDEKVWGYDRAFFAEETLYYPYCDCEDRSILLSRLVRDLLGLKVILVFYPGHLATAVRFTEDVKGDYIMLGNEKFIVCDPTYIGAPVGKTMPRMDNKTAKVILLE